MPIPTPFHPRTAALCSSMLWKEWAGYYTVRSYEQTAEREYFALRNGAGLIDVSPLYKYEVYGPGAAALLSRVTVRDVHALKVGRVTYLCWCDDDGKLVDDGTVTRLDDDYYRLTAAEPTLAWLHRYAHAYDVTIEDSSTRFAALSLQGPTSRDALAQVCAAPLERLRFFGSTKTTIDRIPVQVSRTGYTGDLGYEVWVERDHALTVWDAIMRGGHDYRVLPAGLDAMDITRIEAGFIMNGVDYFSAHHCLIESRKSTPYEMGLGWTVNLDRDPFVGQAALLAEQERGPAWAMVGVEYDWDEFESLCARFGLPPQVPAAAWRDGVPLYDQAGRQMGHATSGTWSPTLKANIALASLRRPHHELGTRLQVEVTVEYQRHRIGATVVQTPFFNPARKRSR